jgi:hypothetical protein
MTQKIQRCTLKFHQKCTNQIHAALLNIYIYIKKNTKTEMQESIQKKSKNKIICIKIQ